jgi:hypothetical protein
MSLLQITVSGYDDDDDDDDDDDVSSLESETFEERLSPFKRRRLFSDSNNNETVEETQQVEFGILFNVLFHDSDSSSSSSGDAWDTDTTDSIWNSSSSSSSDSSSADSFLMKCVIFLLMARVAKDDEESDTTNSTCSTWSEQWHLQMNFLIAAMKSRSEEMKESTERERIKTIALDERCLELDERIRINKERRQAAERRLALEQLAKEPDSLPVQPIVKR